MHRILLFCALVAVGTACSTTTTGGCPAGCNLTAEGTCQPQSPNISYLQPCYQQTDCCTGSCDLSQAVDGGAGICTAQSGSGGSIGSDGSSGSTGSSSSSGAANSTGGTSGSASGDICTLAGTTCNIPSPDGQTCSQTSDCNNPNFYCGGVTTKRCTPLCTVCACSCYGGEACNQNTGVCAVPVTVASSSGSSGTSASSGSGTGVSATAAASGGVSATGTGSSTASSTGGFTRTTSTVSTTSTASASSGAASSTSGAASSTSGAVGTYAGGCTSKNYYDTELEDCTSSTSCGCGQECVTDSSTVLTDNGGGGKYCETPCTGAADCPDPDTNCVNGSCTWNGCNGNNVYGTCDVSAPGANDGYCLPFDDDGNELDLCVVNGTAGLGGSCNVSPFADAPKTFCGSAELCIISSSGDTSGQCYLGCNPEYGDYDCPGIESCYALDNDVPDIGFCD